MISTTQGTFLLDRLITDNVLVAYEVMHIMNNRWMGRKGQLALKFDVSKAYNQMEWHFLKCLLLKLGFPIYSVKSLIGYVTTPSHVVLING